MVSYSTAAKNKLAPTLLAFDGIVPKSEAAFIDSSAVVIGKVEIGEGSSVWPLVVIRGDVEKISIGKNTNIQDGTIIHVSSPTEKTAAAPTKIGDNVTVGHRALIHGCTIENNCLIGMGAIVLDRAIIGEGSLIGAGALVSAGTKIPPRSVVMGIPGKVVRDVRQDEYEAFIQSANKYNELALKYEGS